MAKPVTDARIDLFLGELRLPSIKKNYVKVAKEVGQSGGDYSGFLHALLEEEVNDRRARRIERRLVDATLLRLGQHVNVLPNVQSVGSRTPAQDLADGV